MNHISAETVESTWQRMAQTPVEQVPLIVDRFQNEQPTLMVYLLALDEEAFDESEREVMFYIGMVVWQIMSQSSRKLGSVTPEILEKIEDENYAILEILSSDTEADFLSATREMVENYPEPEVLRYIIESVIEDDLDDPGFREDVKGLAFIQMKIVLDALIESLSD